mmetsp:Transcript_7894/g.11637  ORF Transcript_7894/g.11637 Transcript_7894/m.11637 type:complete len:278 (+) Transcript_7894:31-864(+)
MEVPSLRTKLKSEVNKAVIKQLTRFEPIGCSQRQYFAVYNSYDHAKNQMQLMKNRFNRQRARILERSYSPSKLTKSYALSNNSERVGSVLKNIKTPDIFRNNSPTLITDDKEYIKRKGSSLVAKPRRNTVSRSIESVKRGYLNSEGHLKKAEEIMESCSDLEKINKFDQKVIPLLAKESERPYKRVNELINAMQRSKGKLSLKKLKENIKIKKRLENKEKKNLLDKESMKKFREDNIETSFFISKRIGKRKNLWRHKGQILPKKFVHELDKLTTERY